MRTKTEIEDEIKGLKMDFKDIWLNDEEHYAQIKVFAIEGASNALKWVMEERDFVFESKIKEKYEEDDSLIDENVGIRISSEEQVPGSTLQIQIITPKEREELKVQNETPEETFPEKIIITRDLPIGSIEMSNVKEQLSHESTETKTETLINPGYSLVLDKDIEKVGIVKKFMEKMSTVKQMAKTYVMSCPPPEDEIVIPGIDEFPEEIQDSIKNFHLKRAETLRNAFLAVEVKQEAKRELKADQAKIKLDEEKNED